MSAFLVADLHLTSNSRDEYRWGLFKWLRATAVKRKVKRLVILGDITDAKDRHPATLVNRFVDEITATAEVMVVDAIPGNHDAIDERVPFFGFLANLCNPRLRFYVLPAGELWGNKNCVFLPCTRDYKTAWKDVLFKEEAFDYIFTHQTYNGAKSENGTSLQGVPPSVFKGLSAKVWSGDIHVPQKVNKQIEYVGMPYRKNFGDEFTPRVVLLNDDGTSADLHYPCLSRHLVSVSKLKRLGEHFAEANTGDQFKVRFELGRNERAVWPQIKADIKALAAIKGVDLCGGIEPVYSDDAVRTRGKVQQVSTGVNFDQLVAEYAKRNKLDPKDGMRFMK